MLVLAISEIQCRTTAKTCGRTFGFSDSASSESTLELVFNKNPRSSPNWTPKVMRPGRGRPKNPAMAGPGASP